MKLNIPVSFHGKYEFILKRGDGSEQKVVTHNIATKNIASTNGISTIVLGSGSGTPAVSDNKLFSNLWQFSADSISKVQNVDNDGARVSLSYSVPATAAYVGTITEVGMGTTSTIYTHAMISDAEGNPISIVKTENDALTVVVTLEMFVTTALPLTKRIEHFASVSTMPTLSAILLARLISKNRYDEVLTNDSIGDPYIVDRISIVPRNTILPYRRTYSLYQYTDQETGVEPAYVGWTPNTSLAKLTAAANLRCKTTAFNTHYYRYILLQWCIQSSYNSIGSSASQYLYDIPYALDLSKPEIFPPQRIANIEVATGDGVTADFACPMNYFQKDTEVIYKNGVALTRNVDYTIDNVSNKDALAELMYIPYTQEEQDAVKITSHESLWNSGKYLQLMPESNISRDLAFTYDKTKVCTAFNHTYPLHIDWGSPRVCNCLRGNLYRYYVGTLYVEYSVNDVEWHEATSLVLNESSNPTSNISLTWGAIEARYWRIRITRYGTGTQTTVAYFTTGGYDAFLGYANPLGIQFMTPPAEGDLITMDCYTDIPFKNENFAFNLALDLTLQFS